MKISKEHRDALNEALDETAGYEGDVYVFDVKHIEILRSAVLAMLEDDEQIAPVAPAVDAQPVAWALQEQLDKRESTWRGYLWFVDPKNTAWTPLYASAQSEGLRKDALDALRAAEDALESCYDVTEFPCSGKSKQDVALETVRAALSQQDPQ